MYLRHHLCLCLPFALVSCLAEESTETAQSAAAVSRAAATALASSVNPPVRSSVRIAQWRAGIDTGVESFWPAGARSVQVLITAGDAGDARSGGSPTAHVWIVKDGTSIYKVWRVPTSQWGGPNGFLENLNKFSESQGDLTGASGVILGSIKTPGPKGPPIGPGGGEFTEAMVNQVLATALQINNFVDVASKEVPISN